MKILAIQNRMGIGDMVIFLPFIEAIAKKFNTPVSILVKKNSKASHFIKNNKYIENIIYLERNNKKKRHDGFFGAFTLIKELKTYKFDKVFIFNSSLRFNLISKLSGIKKIYQYALFEKKNQHIINFAKNFLKKELDLEVESNPKIFLKDEDIKKAQKNLNINTKQKNILLGIGGSGETKRIPPEIILKFMEMSTNHYNDCKFFLATGTKNEEQIILKVILNSKFKDKCIALDKMELSDTLPIIKNCDVAVCNDSSFSHLSAALQIETIVLMSDTPLIYGSYNSKMHPIIPDGETTVTHDTLGKNKINPEKIFEKLKILLN
jgi:heptosyltransferase-2